MSGTRKIFESELMKVTNTETFDEACADLEYVRYDLHLEFSKCLCTRPIKNVIVLSHDDYEFHIGRECCKHFKETNKKLFNTIDRIRECNSCNIFFQKKRNGYNLCDDCMILKAGKHKGRTHKEVFEKGMDYCKWILKTPMCDEDKLYDFYLYCLDRKEQINAPSDVLKVGKYKGKKFKEILNKDLNYCLWVLDKTQPKMGDAIYEFYNFLVPYEKHIHKNVKKF